MSSTTDEQRKLRRIVFATSAGTIFEAYDFILFGSLAPIISAQFFAGVNETAAFIFALMTFAAGYFIRPLGALFFGSMGDRTGRKKAFLITISMMGAATFAIGLLPTYAQVGVLAPVLLIALRLVQGLAFGGEYGGAVVYTAEHAPTRQRGLYVGWIQAAAGFALFMSFFVIYVTRTALGEENFTAWGWRIPFLISVFLLAISLWIRLSLEESPLFQQMLAAGKAAKRPLREAFGEWRYLKLVLLVLFGLMMMQGVIFYTAHFYTQFFLTQILKLPSATMTFIMMVVTFLSVPLYVFFSWLSDRTGRKPIILAGAILTVATGFPMFNAFTAIVNPGLATAQQSAPVVVVADTPTCSLQFDPVGQAAFVSSCDITKSTLASIGISYSNTTGAPGALALVQVGGRVVESVEGAGLNEADVAAARAAFRTRLVAALTEAGYPAAVNMAEVNVPLLMVLLMLMLIFSTMVYAPAPAMALELFPTKIRYTGLSLPYHIGSGWFGGFLPAIAFAMVAANGSIYFGLWYPLVMATLSIVVLAFFLPETRNRNLQDI
jgi:MFS family permease